MNTPLTQKKLLGSGAFSNVILIDSMSGASKTVFSREKGVALKAKWLPDKNYFCILNGNGILSFVEAKSGAIYKMIRTNLPSTIDFDFSKDGKKILLTTEKGSCSLRKLPEDSSIIVIRPDGKIEKTPDFYFALVTGTSFTSNGALNECILIEILKSIFF